MKLLAFIISFVLIQTSFAQDIDFNDHTETTEAAAKRTYLEVGIIPTYFVNKLQVGIARVGKLNNEFTFTLLGRYVSDYDFRELHSSIGMHISWNKSIKAYSNGILYVPIWTRTTVNRMIHAEDPVYSTFFLQSIGSGLGYKHTFKNEHQFRMEGNLGLYLTDTQIYAPKKTMIQMVLVPLPRFSFRYMIPIGKQKS